MTKKLIAITGGIGSGKSLVLDCLTNAGYHTLSSDKIVKDLYKTPRVKRILKNLFPNAVKGEKRLSIDYKKLTELAFKDKEHNQKLTNAITPLVLEQILKKASRIKTTAFVEVPLLFECEFEDKFDNAIVVLRDKNLRIESVKERSNLSQKQIEDRMTFQVDYDKKDLSKYIIIVNDKKKEEMENKVLELAKELTK